MLLLSIVCSPLNEPKASAATTTTTPYVYWEGMQLVKGQVGKVNILKNINLWKRDSNNKLVFERVLKAGEQYRVYQYDPMYGGQYGLGGPYFVTNMKEFIQYKTPSKEKLMLVNPGVYGTKLSIGTVTKEENKVIAPGVKQAQLSVESNRGKQEIYKLEVDQSVSEVTFETSLAKDQMVGFETVSSQVKRQHAEGHYIIGAVNGDYFDSNGNPTDLTVQNGELVTTNTTPKAERTIFGVNAEGKAMIGNPDISLSMTVNGENPYVIDSVNKRRNANHLVLYTPYLNGNTMTNELGTEVVLSAIEGTLNGNNTVKAVVKEVIIGKGSQPLLPGEMVLSGHADASEYLKKLVAGDQVEITISYDDVKWSQAKQAIGGRYHVVKNGQATTFDIPGAHPRTAIGIKANGSVFTIVIDGRQKHSVGVTLTELGKIMKDFGAVEAMTFDGGGSSAMMVRNPGDEMASIINRPSDSRERSVANALFFVGLWQPGPLNTLFFAEKEVTLFAGATYPESPVTLKGLDKNNNVISIVDPIQWASTVGKFNEDGAFTAPTSAAKGTITASSGSIKANIPVTITNILDAIKVEKETIMVEQGGTVDLSISGYLAGKKVVEDPAIYHYSVSDQLGTVEKGVFTAGTKDGIGEITISYGKVIAKMKVIVGNPGSIVLEGFEGDLSGWKATGARYNTIQVSAEKNYIQTGKQSLKISYDFSGTIGTSGVYANKTNSIEIIGTPKKIGMWVYGDGKGHWLRAQLRDGSQKEIQLDFTKNLDWTGWKWVEADIPTDAVGPLSLEYPVRYMEVSDENKNKGQIFVDDITAIY
jgi:exopolysaccharide biosynthesis protein